MEGSMHRESPGKAEEDREQGADVARVRVDILELAVRVDETIQAARQCSQEARLARARARAERELLRGYLDQFTMATDRLRGGYVALRLLMRNLGRQEHWRRSGGR
jgi:hypothetical protein